MWRMSSQNDAHASQAFLGASPTGVTWARGPLDTLVPAAMAEQRTSSGTSFARGMRHSVRWWGRNPRAAVFISYVRDDASQLAGRLRDRLKADLGAHAVFRDIDDVQPGDDWAQKIETAVSQAEIVLAVIGPGWQPTAWVLKELGIARERGLPVLPVCMDHAETLLHGSKEISKLLGETQCAPLTDRNFEQDYAGLLGAIKSRAGLAAQRRPVRVAVGLSLIGAVALLAASIDRPPDAPSFLPQLLALVVGLVAASAGARSASTLLGSACAGLAPAIPLTLRLSVDGRPWDAVPPIALCVIAATVGMLLGSYGTSGTAR